MAFANFKAARRIIGLLVLLSFCASVLPIALPQPSLPKPHSDERFACQDRGCGCQSAEQCWSQCCCFSVSERVAWAKKNGVNPPAHVLAAHAELKQEENLVSRKSSDSVPHSSCCKSTKPSTIATTKACCEKSTPSCCSKKSSLVKASTLSLKKQKSSRLILSIMVLKCQGKSSIFSALPWYDLSPDCSIADPAEFAGCRIPLLSLKPFDQRPRPDLPPPRMAISIALSSVCFAS